MMLLTAVVIHKYNFTNLKTLKRNRDQSCIQKVKDKEHHYNQAGQRESIAGQKEFIKF